MTAVVAGNRHRLGAAAILIVIFAGSLPLFELVWRRDALADIPKQPGGWIGAILVVVGSAIVHESLHALSWRLFGNVPWRSMSIRPSWRVMGFVAGLDTPVSASVYRASVALPALALGAFTLALGLVTGSGLFVLWGLFFLLECFSDLVVLLAMRQVPAHARVLDHPDTLGCRVVA